MGIGGVFLWLVPMRSLHPILRVPTVTVLNGNLDVLPRW